MIGSGVPREHHAGGRRCGGIVCAGGRLQAQANFNIGEWTSLPDAYLTSNLQTLFSHPGPARFYTEEQLEALRMLATQRGVVLPAVTPAVSSGPEPRAT